ncbi:MAG: alpha/beta hydrolase [Sarcina sp.]
MSLISHSNGFITKEAKKKFSFKFIFKSLAIVTTCTIVGGLGVNTYINSKNQDKLVKKDFYVTIDDKKNYYNILGKEEPTILFESSSGIGIPQWDRVRTFLQEDYGIKSFAYERDGFGFSDFSEVKSPEDQAKELKLILRKVAMNGPYILVGEGYGSIVMTNFAKLYPELVKGVILISPINEKALGNNNYYNYFLGDKFNRKLNNTMSVLGVSNIYDKVIGLKNPEGLEKYLSEEDYTNYNILRASKGFNAGYYAELQNILSKTSNSQTDGMFSEVPFVIITQNDNKAEQEALKSLGNPEKTKIINSDSNSEVIALEKPELISEGVKYILKNGELKEN